MTTNDEAERDQRRRGNRRTFIARHPFDPPAYPIVGWHAPFISGRDIDIVTSSL